MALAGRVVLLAPRVRARARPRDRAEGRDRGRLGARAGAQGHELRHRLRPALRRRADLRRGVRGEPRVRLHRAITEHRRATCSSRAARSPIGAREYFRHPAVLADRARARREPSKAARVGQQYIVSMPINDAGKPLGRPAHRHRRRVRRPRAARSAAGRRGGARGLALLHARAPELHGGRAPRLGPGEFTRQVDRMRARRLHRRPRASRANDEIGRLLRRIDRGDRPPERAATNSWWASCEDKMRSRHGRAARGAASPP